METQEKAYAKLNLTLDVLGKRPDGYHDMRMLMQTVSLWDQVHLSCTPGAGRVTLQSNRSYIPGDMRNIAVKAAVRFLERRGITGWDVAIRLHKRIPVGAGTAGGSADGAAVLRGLERLFQTGLREEELLALAAETGADVPYCLRGGTALAEGIGERLTPLPPMPDCWIVLCKPAFSLSTAEMFARLDGRRIHYRPDTRGALDALERGDLCALARRVFNVFESVLQSSGPEIQRIRGILYDCGALGAAMTGTGSATFGIFSEQKAAEIAYAQLQTTYRDCFLTRPVPRLEKA